MRVQFGQLKAGSAALKIMLADARSGRNRTTREARSAAGDSASSARRYKQARAREDRDRARAMNRRIRVQVGDSGRPRLRGRTPRKLFYRLGDRAMGSRISSGSGGGRRAGTRSVHFAVTARGFASRTGRGWRNGEGERAALYIVREEALEGGEVGWWSNIAEDRVELVAFHRASEAVERHDRANANVYVSEVIALPADLTARQRRKVVKRYCRYFEKRGIAFTVAMHKPDTLGNERNYHCHIVYSLRPTQRLAPFDWSFAASKCADVNTPAGILARRKLVVDAINVTLKAAGSGQRYTHLSNRARGLGAPSVKRGQNLTWALRRFAWAEARADRLSQFQNMLPLLRHGLAIMQQFEAVGAVVRARMRAAHLDISAETFNNAARISNLRDHVADRLYRNAIAPRLDGINNRTKALKHELDDRLRRTASRLRLPDRLGRQIEATADYISVRHQRRKTLEEARARLATPLIDLAPVRDIVRTRLVFRATQIRDVPVIFAKRIATLATYLAPPAPSPPVAIGGRTSGRERIPTREAVAVLRKIIPGRTPETNFVANLMPGVSMFANAEQLAANRTMRRRLKALAKAREVEAIAHLRARAFARLEAVAAIVTCDDAGLYKVVVRDLFDDERRALRHPDHVADTQTRLAQLHARLPLAMPAGPVPPGSLGSPALPIPSAHSPTKATESEGVAVDFAYKHQQILAALKGRKCR